MKYYGLEYLRFILALSVMLFHSVAYFGTYNLGFLALGVDVFFVISGVVFVLSTYNNKNPLSFVYKRIKRIYPLFIIVTILTILSYLVIGKPYELSLLRDFLMIPSFYSDGSLHLPILYQAWTLQFEILFYALCFIFICFLKNSKVYIYIMFALLTISFLTLALMILGIEVTGINSFIFSEKFVLVEFSVGILIGMLFKMKKIRTNNVLGSILVCLGAVMLYCTWIFNPELDFRGLYFSLSSMIIVFGFMLFEIKNKKTAIYLGSLSYPIYLGHQLVNYTLSTLLGSYVLESTFKFWLLIGFEMISSIVFAYILLKLEQLIFKNLP